MGSLCLECLEYSSGKMYRGVLKSVKDVGEYKWMSNFVTFVMCIQTNQNKGFISLKL